MISIRPASRLFAIGPVAARFQPKTIICQYSAAHFPKRNHREEQREARHSGAASRKPSPPANLPPLDAEHYPFNIIRSKTNNLPVYHYNSHTYRKTTIRHVIGDRIALRDLIQQRLGLRKGDVIINNRSQQVQIRGLLKEDVIQLLKEIGA
ncbi:hypothetical protein L211DRAFT_437813 [Terfezia boudieri ATCC MYA-4762]|uniref:Large ribosomal subunit protein mL49 n=1 Tax=Terfezia boudieri ATCC MYA-4762 TaxID=1051890 RepID=A0A3N4LJ47_9PEZI|nr:hypothetical protein L211DRAFT_437813 [Terfezia boudieri ATCC MYA-4762]